MIDKKLLQQAAQDIDIFQADLSREYDTIVRSRRTSRLRHWAIAASVLLALGCSLSIYIYYNPVSSHSPSTIAQSTTNTVPAQAADSCTAPAQALCSSETTISPKEEDSPRDGSLLSPTTAPAIHSKPIIASTAPAPSHQPSAISSTNSGSSETTLCAPEDISPILLSLLAEVETRTLAMQESDERLQRAIIEELNVYSINQTDKIELSL